MMPELGNFLLCLAAGLALLLSVYPLWGAARQDRRLMALARPLACGLFACIGGAFLLLVHAFVVNDFTVRYVAENSNSALPVWYRVAATGGAHEGSLLLWVLLLSVWTFAVAIFSRRMPLDAVARVLAVMGMIAFGFLLFILFTSNPFSRGLPQYPIDGRDLNPLLQDIGMIFHPPILYMGYVGFSVAFAFAIASLLAGRLDTAWARWSRPWTQAAWMFLTLGIVLGSAWAYYELGWGGWWFWDPVENASFMPWLVGTALLHSLAVTEKRGSFRALDGAAGHRRLLPVPAGHLPGALRGAGFGACLRLRSVARAVYSGTADCRHRRIAAAVRPEGRPGAGAGGTYALVARDVPAWQQYLADGRDAGGAPRNAAAAGA